MNIKSITLAITFLFISLLSFYNGEIILGLLSIIAGSMFLGLTYTNQKEPKSSNLEEWSFLVLLAKVLKAYFYVSNKELDTANEIICQYYKDEKEQENALNQFQVILDNVDINNTEKYYKHLNKNLTHNEILEIMYYLMKVAYADNYISTNESLIMQEIQRELKISHDEYRDLKRRANEEFNDEEKTVITEDENQKEKHKEKTYYKRKRSKSKTKNNSAENNSSENNSTKGNSTEFQFDGFENQEYTEFTDEESRYKYCILVLLAEVMKADTKMMVEELGRANRIIRRYYDTAEKQSEAQLQFLSLLNTRPEMSLVFVNINEHFDYAAKSEIIMELLAVAYADNKYHDKEKALIKRFVKNLNITPQQYNSIYTLFLKKLKEGYYDENENQNENQNENEGDNQNGSDNAETNYETRDYIQDAYDILGMTKDASDEEIKKAYRALAIQYHPDNSASLGDEAVRQATETMKQINVAWDVVKMARGIK